jgi:hypothetical protein
MKEKKNALLNHARPGRGRWLPNWGTMGRAPFAETFHLGRFFGIEPTP